MLIKVLFIHVSIAGPGVLVKAFCRSHSIKRLVANSNPSSVVLVMAPFYDYDTVCFKDDRHLVGWISAAWLDEDFTFGDDCYVHQMSSSSTSKVFEKIAIQGRLPSGHVLVDFPHIECSCLVAESSLELLDRCLGPGQLVKRAALDVQCGKVMSIEKKCTLTPLFPKKYKKRDLTPRKLTEVYHNDRCHGDNDCDDRMVDVPSEQLRRAQDYALNDSVLYNGWHGHVSDMVQDVTIILEDGSRVIPTLPWELAQAEITRGSCSWDSHARLYKLGYRLPRSRCKLSSPDILDGTAGERSDFGQIVSISPRNLRCGKWLKGSYNRAIAPYGVVVEVRSRELDVKWSCTESLGMTEDMRPCTKVSTDDPGLQMYGEPDIEIGQVVRFKQPSTAKSIQHYYYVHRLKTVTTIQWQDGTITQQESTSLIPFDPHEELVLPGNVVSIINGEERKTSSDGPILRCGELGIAQSVQAFDGTIKLRRYKHSEALLDGADRSIPLGPVHTEELLDQIEEHPAIEIGVYGALNPEPRDKIVVRSKFPGFRDFQRASEMIEPVRGASLHTLDWFGEVIHQTLDGKVRVKLGATNPSQEVSFPFTDLVWIAAAGDGASDHDSIADELDPRGGIGSVADIMDLDSRTDTGSENSWVTENDDILQWSSICSSDNDAEMDNGDASETSETEAGRIYNQLKSGRALACIKKHLHVLDVNCDEDNRIPMENDLDSLVRLQRNFDEIVQQLDLIKAEFRKQNHHVTLQIRKHQTQGSAPHDKATVSHEDNEEIPLPYSKLPANQPNDLPVSYEVLEQNFDPAFSPGFDEDQPTFGTQKVRRIAQEHSLLRSSLPQGVFVRTWESRLDCIRTLIIGPADTPYEKAPMIFDLQLKADFPGEPPRAHFHSWTQGKGRINPNLYEDGQVCLSLLGTWDGDTPQSRWSSQSTILQIIVSIQGLILVKDPYFNETGFEEYTHLEELQANAAMYAEKAFVLTRDFIRHGIESPPIGLEDVIRSVYVERTGLLKDIICKCQHLLEDSNESKSLSKGAKIALGKTLKKLKAIETQP